MRIQLNHHKWLINEVASWKLEGIIDTDQAIKILDKYEAEENKKPDVLPILVGVIGSLLVGLGIILLLAKNWSILSKEMRLVISVMPFLTGSILGFLTIKFDRDKWEKEAVGVFIAISIVAGLALIGQTYHSVLPERTLFFVAAILSLPFAYFLRSSLGFLAYILFFTIYTMMAPYGQDMIITIVIAGIFASAMFPYLLSLEAKNKTFELSWIASALSIVGFMTLVSSARNNTYILETLILYFLIIVLVSAFEKTGMGFLSFLSRIGIFIVFFIMTFQFFWSESNFLVVNFSSIVILAGAALGFTAIAIQYNRRINPKGNMMMFFAVIPVLTAVYRILPTNFWTMNIFMWAFNIAFFAVAIWVFVEGVKIHTNQDGSLVSANFGLLLILMLLSKWFFDFDISFLARGILFILLGISFLAFNFIFIKRRGGTTNER